MAQKIFHISMGAIIALIMGLGAGYFIGNGQGQASGRQAAVEDLKQVQQQAAALAAIEASKAANPFQAVNPLEDVETNPFEKTKQILNPFEG